MSTTVTYKGNTLTTVNNETRTLTTSGKYLEDDITLVDITSGGSGSGAVWQDAQGYVHLSDEGDIDLQTKTVSPTESAQTVLADAGYYALERVNVNAIPSNYVGSGVTQRTSSDLSASGATVTAPAGYYASSASKAVATGTTGTPTATKGAVSNHSISVTPSVTNTTGYITGSTKTGTAVTVTASELASGNKTIVENGTNIDVVGYSTVTVNVSGGREFTATIVSDGKYDTATPLFSYVEYRPTSGSNTRYYTAGDTFTFKEGEQLYARLRTYQSTGQNVILVDGEVVQSAVEQTSYTYILPDHDIEIKLSSNPNVVGIVAISKVSNEYKFIASTSYDVSTTSTSVISVGTLETGDTSIWTSDKMVYIKIRRGNGNSANGYFYGCDAFVYNFAPHFAPPGTVTYTLCGNMYVTQQSGGYITSPVALNRTTSSTTTQGYGIYPVNIYSNGDISFSARYSATPATGTISGTYNVEVYLLNWPNGVPPYFG